MKYNFLILSTEKTEKDALALCNSLSDKGAKCITNADPKQRTKSLFEAVSTSGKVLVLIPSEIDLEEDEQFLELLDAVYIEGTEINSVFVTGNEIPEQLLIYLGRRDAIDLDEVKNFEVPVENETPTFRPNSFDLDQDQNTQTMAENMERSDSLGEEHQIEEFLENAIKVLNDQIQLNDDETKEFITILTEMAASGNIEAIYGLGRFYDIGKIVEKDLEKATTLYETAASAGHPNAKEKLGLMYLRGEITRKNLITGQKITENADLQQGLKLLEESANLDNAGACYVLGGFHKDSPQHEKLRRELNINIKPDNKKYIYYYEKAAQLNHLNCLLSLAEEYKEGNIVFKDYEKALDYMERAAELGSLYAIKEMGIYYGNGEYGAAKSDRESLKWFRKGVELYNDPASKYNMGFIFYKNEDFPQAEYWFSQVLNSDDYQHKYGDIEYDAKNIVELKNNALENLKEINPKKYRTNVEKGLIGLIKVIDFLR